jgi:hypothetical protein
MKKLPIFLFITAILGCTHLYKLYEYKPVSVPCKFGVLQINAHGDWKKISEDPEITIKAEPYYVRIAYMSKDQPGKDIQINVISVTPSSEKWSVYELNVPGKTKKPFSRIEKTYTAEYTRLIQNIYPDHEPIKIELEIHYRGTIEKVYITLDPFLKKEHHNNTFDRFMSV